MSRCGGRVWKIKRRKKYQKNGGKKKIEIKDLEKIISHVYEGKNRKE